MNARLRFPGGRLGATDWTALAAIAADHGGEVHLAEHGGLQIRGVRDESLLRERAGSAGLSERAMRDGAGSILASPMAGRLDGHRDLGDLPALVDVAVAGRRDATALSDSFLLGLDDGSGDVLAHRPDLTAVAHPDGERVGLHVAGRDVGLETLTAHAADVLADAAGAFAAHSDGTGRVPGSGDLHHLVVVVLGEHPRTSPGTADPGPMTTAAVEVPPVGWVDTTDGLVSLLATVPHGVVPARLAEFLGAVDRPSTVSADGVIGLHALTEGMAEQVVRVLAPMGMVFDAASPWADIRRGDSA